MKTLSKLHEVVTGHGNVLRGIVQVDERDFIVESDGEKWVNVIDSKESRCETFELVGTDIIPSGGEILTEAWTDADWAEFRRFLF